MIATFSALFFAAFLAATLIPAQSESLLAYLIMNQPSQMVGLVIVATLGNVTGSLVNYALGLGLGKSRNLSWLRPSEKNMARAMAFYQRYGRWTLLLSWLPVIGDPLTLIAGVMKETFWRFLMLVSVAKFLRYVVVAYFATQYA